MLKSRCSVSIVQKSIDVVISEIDQLIIQGKLAQAKKQYVKLFNFKLTRLQRLALASLARRLARPLDGVKLLYSVVRPKNHNPLLASEDEKAEYAGNLVRLGLNQEALTLLNTIQDKKCIKAELFKAFAYVSNWDYAASISPLEKVIKSPYATLYDKMIAKVNLAIAYQELNMTWKGLKFCEELIDELVKQKFSLLLSIAQETNAWLLIAQGKLDEAFEVVQFAKSLVQNSDTIDNFLLEKIEVIILALKNKSKAKNLLQKLKLNAIKLSHYESIRDLDFWIARLTQDENLFQYLYFGTPYVSYREKIKRNSNKDFDRENVIFVDAKFKKINKSDSFFDLYKGEKNGKFLLKLGQKLWKVHQALFKDFYRPMSLHQFYQEVFSASYFNPESSYNQIHQVLHRLRKFWKKEKIGLDFVIKNQKIYLKEKDGKLDFCVSINKDVNYTPVLQKVSKLIIEFAQTSKMDQFTRLEFQKKFKLSERTANRYLKLAVTHGLVTAEKDYSYLAKRCHDPFGC